MVFQREVGRLAALCGVVFGVAVSTGVPQAGAQVDAPAGLSADVKQTVEIEAGPLSEALVTLSDIFVTSIFGDDTLLGGRISSPISGQYTLREAVDIVLQGTDLVAVRPRSGGILVTTPAPADRDEKAEEDPDPPLPSEPIIVYGLRDKLSLLEVTSSLAITTGEEIEREPLVDLNDVLLRVPGVSTPGDNRFAIRGVDQSGPSGGTGQTLTIYLDDSPISANNLNVGPFSVWDLEQVEVFRGPQSTNLGRNTLAGAIYLRTGDPTYEWEGKARAELGSDGQRWGAVAFGGGLVEDKIAFRVAADFRETDGFITNTFLEDAADATELWSGRFKLRFDPTADFSVITTTSYSENRIGFSGLSLTNNVPGGPELPASEVRREVAEDLKAFAEGQTFIQSVNAHWYINDVLDLQSITTYQESEQSRADDFDNTPLPLASLLTDVDDSALSQELRLGMELDRFNGVVGLYYAGIEQDQEQSFVTPANLVPGFSFFPASIIIDRTIFPEQTTDNYAFFVDGEYRLTDRVDVLFGARYDVEDLNIVNRQSISATDIPPELRPLADAFLGDGPEERVDASYDAFLPKLGLRWRAGDRTNLAFIAQRAYRAGGSQTDLRDGSLIDFDPEFLWNYELSARTSLLDGDLSLAANVYYSDWRDQQVLEPLPDFPILSITVNAGESELYGLEGEFEYELTSSLSIYGSAAYTVAEFIDFVNGSFDPEQPISDRNNPNFGGNRFPNAPRLSMNAGFDYRADNGLFGGIDVNHRSSSFTSSANLDTRTRDAFTLVNARIGYAINENLTVSAVVRNLLDDEYFLGVARAPDGNNSASLGDPRNWAIRLDARF